MQCNRWQSGLFWFKFYQPHNISKNVTNQWDRSNTEEREFGQIRTEECGILSPVTEDETGGKELEMLY